MRISLDFIENLPYIWSKVYLKQAFEFYLSNNLQIWTHFRFNQLVSTYSLNF